MYVQGTVSLILQATKTSSDQFWVYPLANLFLYFEILTSSPTLKLGLDTLESYCIQHKIRCNVNWFHFYCSVNCFIVFISNIVKHIKINIFWNSCYVVKNLVFQRSNKSFSKNSVSFILCWVHFSVIYFQKPLKTIIVTSTTLINPYFFWFVFWDYFLKCINNTNSSFLFQRNKPCIFTKNINCTQ